MFQTGMSGEVLTRRFQESLPFEVERVVERGRAGSVAEVRRATERNLKEYLRGDTVIVLAEPKVVRAAKAYLVRRYPEQVFVGIEEEAKGTAKERRERWMRRMVRETCTGLGLKGVDVGVMLERA